MPAKKITEKTDSAAQHVGGGAGIFICIANMWMLLDILRVINSGWNLRLFADCTYKMSAHAVALMGFAVNSMNAVRCTGSASPF